MSDYTATRDASVRFGSQKKFYPQNWFTPLSFYLAPLEHFLRSLLVEDDSASADATTRAFKGQG